MFLEVRDLRTLLIFQLQFSSLSLKYQLIGIERVFCIGWSAAISVWITRETILRGNDIVLCVNVLANKGRTDFSYLSDLTLP